MTERGLAVWLGIVTAGFVASALFEQAELGLMIALAGMFAVAHAVDVDRRWSLLHGFLAWIPPAAGMLMFVGIAWYFRLLPLPAAERSVGTVVSLAAAAASLLLAVRPLTSALARMMFGGAASGPADRLGARLVALGFLLAVPGWLLVRGLAEAGVIDSLALDAPALIGSMAGFTLLSLGGVGLLVRRDLRAAAARLGLAPMRGRDLLVMVAGLAGIVGLNWAAEWVASEYLPGAYAHDQAMNERIAGRLTRGETLLLGISAGVGEELAMRGALQPRLGLVTTSVLFAVLHVHYSPLGIGTIAALGVILGVIRNRSNTTTAIAVHVLYDIFAAIGIQQGG